ncbi:MAG: pentapeptide repeat-containing protein [Calditrichota bacterium]
MANSDHLAIIKSGVEEWNSWRKQNLELAPDLREANLRGMQLDSAILRDCDLSGANLSGASLKEADLSKATLNETNLSGADLSRANLYRAKMRRCNLTGADLRQVVMYQANLSYANLSRANLSKANMRKANLTNADLSKVYFSKGKAEETIFTEANLEKANLYESNLVQAELTDANLSGAVMYKANISKADLEGANLINANLNLTNLQGTTLNRTKLEGSKLTGSSVSGISIHGVEHSNSEQLDLVLSQSEGVLVKCDGLETARLLEGHLKQTGDSSQVKPSDMVVLIGNFAGDRKIIRGRILEEIRKESLNPLQLECLSKPEAEFRSKLNRLAGIVDWLIFDATQAADLVEEVLPILTNYPDLKVTAFVEGSTRWQVATPFAHYVERFPLGEYEQPEDIPELLAFSRSSDTNAPRLIILPEGETPEETPTPEPKEPEKPTVVFSESEETVQLNPSEILAMAGTELELEDGEVVADNEQQEEDSEEQVEDSKDVVHHVQDEEDSSDATHRVQEDNDEQVEDSKDVVHHVQDKEEDNKGVVHHVQDDDSDEDEYTEETLGEHYTGDDSDSFVGENVVIVPSNGKSEPQPVKEAAQESGNIVITAAAGSNPFTEVMNPEQKKPAGTKVDLQFPESGKELVPAQAKKTVVILEGDERKKPTQTKSGSKVWIGLAAAAVLLSAMFFGWGRLHTDVMLVAPKAANAFIKLDGKVVDLHNQEGDNSYYLASSQFVGNTDLEVWSTQLSEMGQEEFTRYKAVQKQVDIERSADGPFTYQLDFEPLYSVRKVAEGKFPAIANSGNSIAYIRAASENSRSNRQDIYLFDLKSGEETKIEPRNRGGLNWDGERPYLLGDGSGIYIGAYQYRSDRTLPYRIDTESGRMTALKLPAKEKWLSFLPLAEGEKIAFQNTLFDTDGNEIKNFSPDTPYLSKLYPAGNNGLLFFEKTKNKKNRISFSCMYTQPGKAQPQKLFSVSSNIPPFVSASNGAERVVVSSYSGLNREFLTTIQLWQNGESVDLTPRFIDGSREFSDGSEYHKTEAVIDAAGKRIVYEYESNIYLLEIADGVSFVDLQAAVKPVK